MTTLHIHKRYPFWIDDQDGRRIANTEGVYLDPEQNKALAQLICQAVNAHAALVRALEQALNEATRTPAFGHQADDPTIGTLSHETIELLVDALATAKGEI